MKITLHQSDFAVNSFAYDHICEQFDIDIDPDTGEYPETIIFNINTCLIETKYDTGTCVFESPSQQGQMLAY